MKTTWTKFKEIVDENFSTIFESSDADNVSYRLHTTVGDANYDCNVMKSPPGNAELVEYETNYQPTARTGG